MRFQSQKVAYYFFATCMLLLSLQIVYGFIMAFAHMGYDVLHNVIPFNTARTTHTNLLVVWLQEEPKNMGAWFYVKDRFDERLSAGKYQNMIRCVARKTSPSPAAGLLKVHEREQKELIERALSQ